MKPLEVMRIQYFFSKRQLLWPVSDSGRHVLGGTFPQEMEGVPRSGAFFHPICMASGGGLGICARGHPAEVPEQTCAQSSPEMLESGSLDHLLVTTSDLHPHSMSLRLSEFTKESNKCFPEPLACLGFL